MQEGVRRICRQIDVDKLAPEWYTSLMRTPKPSKIKFPVPQEFRALVQEHLAQQGLSIRQAAAQAGLSHTFLSRILTGERGLPEDAVLLRLAKVIGVQPPDALLVKAGRLTDDLRAPLLRATGPLSEKDFQQVMETMESVLRKYQTRPRRP